MIGDDILIIGATISGTRTLFAQPWPSSLFWRRLKGLFDFEPTKGCCAVKGIADATKAPCTAPMLREAKAGPDATIASDILFGDLQDEQFARSPEIENNAGSRREFSLAIEAPRAAGPWAPGAATKTNVLESLKKRAREGLKQVVNFRSRFTPTEEARTQLLHGHQVQLVRLRSKYEYNSGGSLV